MDNKCAMGLSPVHTGHGHVRRSPIMQFRKVHEDSRMFKKVQKEERKFKEEGSSMYRRF